ncbi:MAG TPA: MarR family transcriptional regulator [Kouleothrix sp.]|nr:MarR family transcriptional regulator [Kouleothrix sp.]
MDLVLDTTEALLAVLPLLNRLVAAEVRREAGEETTMPQFRVLAHLAAAPLTLSALAKKRRVSLQAMSELVQVLVAHGWVERLPDPNDRRQALLQLTDNGRSHYERAQTHTLQRLVPLLARLNGEELAAVRVALPALHRVLAQEECDAGDERASAS